MRHGVEYSNLRRSSETALGKYLEFLFMAAHEANFENVYKQQL